MVFNSFTFLVFFVLFFILYWGIFNRNFKQQNLLLLLGSYLFYAWSDWRFLFFLIGISLLNFFLGIYIEKNTKYKQFLLYIGLIQGIGGLAFFKYYNFFITSFKDFFHSLNININLHTLTIIVPLGISFFTFRTLSYLIDINKGKITATKDWIVFFNYVSFFPTILSGPIDKSKSFVPQLEKKREFTYSEARNGMLQILWGVFKKVVIADNCANSVSTIFDNYQTLSGSTLLLGAFLYTFQIYADFSGYSDMAIGFSRILGFKITKNFDFPFFSQNIAEFWRKWHISLTSWLTEYVFTPLSIAFRDYGKLGLIIAIIINFTICGIWHGANWTYVLFGFLHGCYFIPLIINGTMNKKKKIDKDKLVPSFKEFINIFGTFVVVMLTFVLFRANTVQEAFTIISKILSPSILYLPKFYGMLKALITLIFVLIFILTEWNGRNEEYATASLGINWKRPLRYALYYAIIIAIFWFHGEEEQFIYFQF